MYFSDHCLGSFSRYSLSSIKITNYIEGCTTPSDLCILYDVFGQFSGSLHLRMESMKDPEAILFRIAMLLFAAWLGLNVHFEP